MSCVFLYMSMCFLIFDLIFKIFAREILYVRACGNLMSAKKCAPFLSAERFLRPKKILLINVTYTCPKCEDTKHRLLPVPQWMICAHTRVHTSYTPYAHTAESVFLLCGVTALHSTRYFCLFFYPDFPGCIVQK